MIELLDLLADVSKECIAGPASNHHDEEDGATSEEHGHGCTRADGVCADLVRCNVECVLPDCRDSIRSAFEICLDVMCLMRSCFQMAGIGVSLLAPGYDRIRRTMAAAARTGHRVMSPEAIWVVVSFFSSFFCISNVMLRQLEYSRLGSS